MASASEVLGDDASLFGERERELVSDLCEAGQSHLFSSWPPTGEDSEHKKRLVGQLSRLDETTPGGLVEYVERAKALLKSSKDGENSLAGYTPEVPPGSVLNCRSDEFVGLERVGAAEAGRTAFVLVAGGLGERLGYSGIKLALPSESARGACFLQLYVEYILALQKKSGEDCDKLLSVPTFVIMTSDDTHEKTQALLEASGYFGMNASQVRLLKQDKVPCLADNEATLALSSSDKYSVQTKPHGHGDVHALLHRSGVVKRWAESGLKWVCFFQDTNALVFRAIPASLAISKQSEFSVNSLAVPRKAKEAIGAICKLVKAESSMTLNVEYNQLDPLLRSTVNPEGDVNDPSTGFSPYPGNINQLIFSVPDYHKQLESSKGHVPEFVNPKYKDSTKTSFKSPTRLECMMQDYPRTIPSTSKVGFTLLEVWVAYSPVKNSPAEALAKAEAGNPSHSATTGELDIYRANCNVLKHLGASVEDPAKTTFNGIYVQLHPRIVWSPSFACTTEEVSKKIDCKTLQVSQGSSLVLEGENITINGLSLNGSLVIRASNGARVTVKNLRVDNKGWEWRPLDSAEGAREEERMRGFTVIKHETRVIEFDSPGEYTVDA
ncbi:UTP--glucose-1-phosphate uridylyltransferase [Chloropicon primus]|uniref:UTP-monosaccharide-1-phosphate uridylyltransferase n=2 Tax=Chloropicon primus TaxID=1764295 RepID=A0A5B8MJW1_9CHLO|nr:UTP--glucose-1-phosphate uridylyltransferase [Chloropicon primus]UPQ99782.1 UTP--glucose-1-phosphate uridylyltransferase [Chloropicon primus]|eukprot:QDZ20571.1 UTP--glucose-1-phosphate uridylyltransferase [Chloropicon primus]